MWELAAPRRERFSALTIAATTPVLSLVVLVGTVQELSSRDVSVDVGGAVSVTTDERLWPAWAGLGLALVLVGVATARLAASARCGRGAQGRATVGAA